MSQDKEIKTYAAGEEILKEGETGGNIMIIESGTVEVYRSRKGIELSLAKLGSGEMLGVMSLTGDKKRAASARALTDVSLTVISASIVQRMMNEIPQWGTAILKDLVRRVEQADELYGNERTDDKSRKNSGVGEYLRVAMAVAEGFGPLAEMAVTNSGGKEAPINKILESLSKIIGEDFKIVKTVFQIFTNAKLLDSSGSGTVRSSVEALYQLQSFTTFVQEHLKNQTLSMLTTTFTSGEREYLRKVVKAIEYLGVTGDVEIGVAFNKIEESLRSNFGIKYDPHPIKEAAHLNLLKIESDPINKIRTSPLRLKNAIAYIEVISQIDALEAPDQRVGKVRTLLY